MNHYLNVVKLALPDIKPEGYVSTVTPHSMLVTNYKVRQMLNIDGFFFFFMHCAEISPCSPISGLFMSILCLSCLQTVRFIKYDNGPDSSESTSTII